MIVYLVMIMNSIFLFIIIIIIIITMITKQLNSYLLIKCTICIIIYQIVRKLYIIHISLYHLHSSYFGIYFVIFIHSTILYYYYNEFGLRYSFNRSVSIIINVDVLLLLFARLPVLLLYFLDDLLMTPVFSFVEYRLATCKCK